MFIALEYQVEAYDGALAAYGGRAVRDSVHAAMMNFRHRCKRERDYGSMPAERFRVSPDGFISYLVRLRLSGELVGGVWCQVMHIVDADAEEAKFPTAWPGGRYCIWGRTSHYSLKILEAEAAQLLHDYERGRLAVPEIVSEFDYRKPGMRAGQWVGDFYTAEEMPPWLIRGEDGNWRIDERNAAS